MCIRDSHQQQRGNGHDAIFFCQFRFLVDVDLDHFRLSYVFIRDLCLLYTSGEDEVGCGYPLYYFVQILNKTTNEYVPVEPESTITKHCFRTQNGEIDLKREFAGLTPGTEYTLELYAVNPLFKPSETITFDFSTSA